MYVPRLANTFVGKKGNITKAYRTNVVDGVDGCLTLKKKNSSSDGICSREQEIGLIALMGDPGNVIAVGKPAKAFGKDVSISEDIPNNTSAF